MIQAIESPTTAYITSTKGNFRKPYRIAWRTDVLRRRDNGADKAYQAVRRPKPKRQISKNADISKFKAIFSRIRKDATNHIVAEESAGRLECALR